MSDMKGMKTEVILLLLCLSVVFIRAQVIFYPDPEEDVQLQAAVLIPPVNVTTVRCYPSSPIFKVQYVAVDDYAAIYDADFACRDVCVGWPVNGSACGQNVYQYRIRLYTLQFIADPSLVGRTFKLNATLDNNAENSTISKRTYTFPAPFNLTGSSKSALVNTSFTWTCHVTSNNTIIDWIQNSITLGQVGMVNGACLNSGIDSYIYDCQPSDLTYTLTIPGSNMTEELQASIWRCRDVHSEVNGSRFMKLGILVPVTTVTITPGSGSSLVEDEYHTVTFTCATNNANPSPTVLLFIGSSQVISQTGSNRTTFTLNITRAAHGLSVRCVAWNSGNTANLSDSTTLNVRFPPTNNEALQILGDTSDQVLYENNLTMISLYCTQPGGNPVSNMTFTCGSQTGSNGNTATEAIRRLNLINDRNLNGQQCVCLSTHINGFMSSKNVSFIVYYPPSIPTISASSPFPWKAQGAYSLTCNTTPGNPAATTYIWKEGGSVLPVTSQTYQINPLQTTDNGRQLSCQVSNNFTLHENIEVKSSVTTIQVESPAIFQTKESYLLAQPNITASIGIPFYCNPPVTTSGVSWINKTGLDDKPVVSSEMISFSLVDEDVNLVIGQTLVDVRGQKAVMNITSVQTYHRGYYVLRIQNNPSIVASWGIILDVTVRPYPPRNLRVQCRDGIARLSWGFSNNFGLDVSFQVFYKEESEEKYNVVEKNSTNMGKSYIEYVEVLSIKPKVIYYFKVASQNINGLSEYTDSKACVIFDEASSTEASVGGVAGGITGAFIMLIAAMAVVMVVREKRYRIGKGARSKENKSTFENYEDIQSPNRSNGQDEACSTSASVGGVAGGITGAFIMLIAAMAVVMVVRERRYRIGKGAKSKENKSTFENYEDIQSPNRSNGQGTETGHRKDERSTYEELQTSRDLHTYDHVDNRTQYHNL